MNIENIHPGDYVLYIPEHLLVGDRSKMIKDENLGKVTSKNHTYAFVKFNGKTNSEATNPRDLFTLKFRPDLIEKIILHD